MKKTIAFVIAAVSLLTIAVAATADLGYTMTYLPGTTDTVTNLPAADTGVSGPYTVSSTIPQRQGYEFIDWTLDYKVLTYKVTYVVNQDPTYGLPEGSTVPTDPTEYAPNDYVDVADQLTTAVDYAYNENDEKVKGTWTFTPWDKDDFPITEDTTITGGWSFTETPATKYHYYVEYWLWDGKNMIKQVHARKEVEIDSLGVIKREDAIPLGELKKPYSVKKNGKYQYYIVTPYQEKLISKDGYIIYILYAEIPKGQ